MTCAVRLGFTGMGGGGTLPGASMASSARCSSLSCASSALSAREERPVETSLVSGLSVIGRRSKCSRSDMVAVVAFVVFFYLFIGVSFYVSRL